MQRRQLRVKWKENRTAPDISLRLPNCLAKILMDFVYVFFCIFSDDLLTYDIGDVIDDQVLIGADEDELLLSDDGK